MRPQTIKPGSEVYTKNPQRFIPGCTCIVGQVKSVKNRNGIKYVELHGDVGMIGGGWPLQCSLPIEDVGPRIGTPISKLSTQPGTPGYDEWCRISRSWGY